MRHALHPHRDHVGRAAVRVDVDVERHASARLTLRYSVTGAVGDLLLPPVVTPARVNELWQHTCFEAFVRSASSRGYREFNFAPSTEWAAYQFNGYRSGMLDAPDIAPPHVETRSGAAAFELQASLDLSGLPADASWQLALSAVIEEKSGRKSYWALAHPPGKADFHHPDSFVLELPQNP